MALAVGRIISTLGNSIRPFELPTRGGKYVSRRFRYTVPVERALGDMLGDYGARECSGGRSFESFVRFTLGKGGLPHAAISRVHWRG